jgi:hypothetical protein
VLSPAFAVVGRVQQPIDHALVGVRRGVGQEVSDLLWARRQADQVQRQPADQGGPVGFGGGGQPHLFHAGQEEVIDGVAGPGAVADGREGGPLRPAVGPVLLPGGALLDPALQEVDLLRGQRFPGSGGGHADGGLLGGHPGPQFALVQLEGDDRPGAALRFAEGRFAVIQPEVGLAGAGVGPVAGGAVVGQDRADVPVEVDGCAGRRRGGVQGGCEEQPRNPGEGNRAVSARAHGVGLGQARRGKVPAGGMRVVYQPEGRVSSNSASASAGLGGWQFPPGAAALVDDYFPDLDGRATRGQRRALHLCQPPNPAEAATTNTPPTFAAAPPGGILTGRWPTAYTDSR